MPPTSIRKKLTLVCLVPILAALADAQVYQSQKFQPPEGTLTVGLRETERHRPPIPEQRIGRGHGSPGSVFFWAHVDANGRVLEVREFQTEAPFHFDYRTDALAQTIRKVTYRPFLRNGVATEAWVQDLVEVGPESDKAPPSGTERNFPALVKPTDFSIKLSRSACFGPCPIYSVLIHGDGTVEFHGAQYVAVPGEHRARIAPETAAQLLDRFRAAEFFELKDKYVANVTDNPTFSLELAIGEKKKAVTDYVGTWVGMPMIVTELEDAVDDAAGTDRWVGSGPGTLEAMRDAGIAPNSKQATEILVYAVETGKAEVVRSLLAEGTPVRVSDAKRGTGGLLTIASFVRDREGQREVFKALLEDAAVRADKAGMQDALGQVAGDGSVEVARTLIAAGADPTQLFRDTYQSDGKPDQTYLMRAAASGSWDMLDDALSRPHDVHAVDSRGRSAVGHVVWSAPPEEDILPLVDRLLAAGAGKQELTRALADACNAPQWHNDLVKRGADSTVCGSR